MSICKVHLRREEISNDINLSVFFKVKTYCFAVAVIKDGGSEVMKGSIPWGRGVRVYLWVRVRANRYISHLNVNGSDQVNPCLFLYSILLNIFIPMLFAQHYKIKA
jgi:hypothetical protein